MDPLSPLSVQIAEDYLTAIRKKPLPFKSKYFKGPTAAPVGNLTVYECSASALRLGTDEFRCSACGIVWARDETRPPCASTLK